MNSGSLSISASIVGLLKVLGNIINLIPARISSSAAIVIPSLRSAPFVRFPSIADIADVNETWNEYPRKWTVEICRNDQTITWKVWACSLCLEHTLSEMKFPIALLCGWHSAGGPHRSTVFAAGSNAHTAARNGCS